MWNSKSFELLKVKASSYKAEASRYKVNASSYEVKASGYEVIASSLICVFKLSFSFLWEGNQVKVFFSFLLTPIPSCSCSSFQAFLIINPSLIFPFQPAVHSRLVFHDLLSAKSIIINLAVLI